MPGSFVDDVCDRERPALSAAVGCHDDFPVLEIPPSYDFSNYREACEFIERSMVQAFSPYLTKPFVVGPPGPPQPPQSAQQNDYVALCNCPSCRDGVARTVALTKNWGR